MFAQKGQIIAEEGSGLNEGLVEKSLLQRGEDVDGEPRLTMLETIREFAGVNLCEADEAEPVQRRHLEFFLQLAEEAEPQLEAAEMLAWFERLEAEHDNLRAALACQVAR